MGVFQMRILLAKKNKPDYKQKFEKLLLDLPLKLKRINHII